MMPFTLLAVRIKVSGELAEALAIMGAIFGVVVAFLFLTIFKKRIEEKYSLKARRWVVFPLALILSVFGLGVLTLALQIIEPDPRTSTALALPGGIAVGLGAMCLAWGRARVFAALLALPAGVLLVSKPFLFPVLTERNCQFAASFDDCVPGLYPFGWDAETHLYYLLPGLALIALVAIIVLRARSR